MTQGQAKTTLRAGTGAIARQGARVMELVPARNYFEDQPLMQRIMNRVSKDLAVRYRHYAGLA